MFRQALVTHRLPSQTKEFSSHFVTCSSFRVALQIAMSHFALFPFRGGSMVTANVLRSVRTVESDPLLVDATTAAALCGKHLRTWRAWQAAGRIPRPIRIGRSLMWRFSELEAWVAAGCPPRKHWVLLVERVAECLDALILRSTHFLSCHANQDRVGCNHIVLTKENHYAEDIDQARQ
jgi:predicted DNA-binding transcriptional regulator AlpA